MTGQNGHFGITGAPSIFAARAVLRAQSIENRGFNRHG